MSHLYGGKGVWDEPPKLFFLILRFSQVPAAWPVKFYSLFHRTNQRIFIQLYYSFIQPCVASSYDRFALCTVRQMRCRSVNRTVVWNCSTVVWWCVDWVYEKASKTLPAGPSVLGEIEKSFKNFWRSIRATFATILIQHRDNRTPPLRGLLLSINQNAWKS